MAHLRVYAFAVRLVGSGLASFDYDAVRGAVECLGMDREAIPFSAQFHEQVVQHSVWSHPGLSAGAVGSDPARNSTGRSRPASVGTKSARSSIADWAAARSPLVAARRAEATTFTNWSRCSAVD